MVQKSNNNNNNQSHYRKGVNKNYSNHNSNRSYNGMFSKPTYQICGFDNHAADICHKRYEPHRQLNAGQPSLLPTPPSINYSSYGTPVTWYPDAASTNHITSNIANSSISGDYKGTDKLIVSNGRGSQIANTCLHLQF